MKQESINYLTVGGFTISMLLLLGLIIYRITGSSVDTQPYFVHYNDITGINIGSAVSYGGYQIGRVESIDPERSENKTRFKLVLAIRSDWQIPDNSVARIIASGLLADKQIDIKEGDSEQFLQPGETIRGQPEVSIMGILNSVAYEIEDLSDQSLKPLLKSLGQHIDAVGKDLGAKLPQITGRIDELLTEFNDTAKRMNDFVSSQNQEHVSSVLKNADQISGNLLHLTEGFDAAREQVDAFIAESRAVVTENRLDMRAAVKDLRGSLDAVAQNIDAIVYNLETASRNMSEFSRQIRANPGALLDSKPPPDPEALQR